ncbi:hypothetical protein B0H14DRAFT_1501166 [Mycena olivaceomarginata]|nr:hypothetical protein B0H14DRAFT_1501166 [Mycena olivaceomarginata]
MHELHWGCQIDLSQFLGCGRSKKIGEDQTSNRTGVKVQLPVTTRRSHHCKRVSARWHTAICTALPTPPKKRQRGDRLCKHSICTLSLPTTPSMSFTLEHTHISGGTFNNVSGNMSQVINSYVAVPAGQQVIDGAQRLLPTVAESTGVVGPQQAGRQIRNTHRPYDIPARRLICAPEAGFSGVADTEGPADGLRITACSASFQNPSPGFAGYGGNIPNHPQTFNSIGGDMNQVNVTSYGQSGLDTLYPFVAMEALHNSGECFQEPACHPGTRTAVLSKLHAWSLDTSTESQLLWLHGSAGMGKSAIAQMFAGECADQGRLGASFFFRRGHPKRGTWHNLITTIAYQLAISVPELLVPIKQAVESDKLVVGRALAVQFQQILAKSFRNAPASQFLPIIILDGLDECDDLRVQQHILCLFIGAICSGEFSTHILICSRPEPHLREVLQTPQTFGICREFILSADVAAYDDIRTYLSDEFSRIHSKLAARGITLGLPWPAPETLTHLVKKSSGIFIYAATVIRFVDDEYSHPWERLESVLKLGPHSTAPLDDLYTQILSVLPHNQQSLRILHAVWQVTLSKDPEEIDLLLGLHSGTCRLALRGLNSLLYIPSARFGWAYRENITYLHASFGDYISNPHRSQQWCVSIPWLKSDYVYCLVRMLSVPPPTFSIRELYRQVVGALPTELVEEQPTEALITLFRGGNFQKSLFLSTCNIQWPQRESSYPLDLIRLWEEHSFISTLAWAVDTIPEQGSATFKYDWIYGMILARHTDLLFFLRLHIIYHPDYYFAEILDLSGLSYRVFQPFLQFCDVLDFPLPEGDSPLDFLSDPHRAAGLYRDPHDIAEEVMMLYLSRAKEVLLGTSDRELSGWFLKHLLKQCPTSSKLLHELQSLDLRQLCDHHAANEASHYAVHDMFLKPGFLNSIVDWLWKFPDPPLHAIAFWKIQIAHVEQCIENNNFKGPIYKYMDEDTD